MLRANTAFSAPVLLFRNTLFLLDKRPKSIQIKGGLASGLLWFKAEEQTGTQTCCSHIFEGENDPQIPEV